jgi:predicted transcriptional regulator of viral defense system
MTRRSLSKREGDLVLALEWEKQRFISLKDIRRRLKCSAAYARYMAHALHEKGWLEPLAKGQYQLIGAERGPRGVPEMNPYVVARFLPKPYFFAYRFACEQHGLLTQVPTTIHVALKRPKRPMELKNVRFEFVVLTPKRFFGLEEITVLGEKIQVSDLERTVLDALDRPELVGGIEASIQAMFHAAKEADYARLLGYLKRMDDRALARRFGYLADQLKLELPKELSKHLQAQVNKNPAYLGSPARWGKDGQRDPDWNLVINVPKLELLGEVRIG